MSIQFLSADQNYQDETTNYWFNVDGEQYALSDTNRNVQLLDCDGYPIEACNDRDGVLTAILEQHPDYWNLL